MRRAIVIAAMLLAGCACTQERETLTELREVVADSDEHAAALTAAESALGNCREREAQAAAILAKIIAAMVQSL